MENLNLPKEINKDGRFMDVFVELNKGIIKTLELNKGIIKTLELTIDELPFWKIRKKRHLIGCIAELEEYIEDLIN